MATQPPDSQGPAPGVSPVPDSPASTENDEKKWTEKWMKRIALGEKGKEEWEKDYEVPLCYQLWRGNQYDDPYDEFEERKVQINKVHPTVKSSIPALYFHNVFARVHASPALADTPGQRPGLSLDDKAQLIQDYVNTLVRDSRTAFDEATHLAVKEGHWAIGAVEVKYDAVPVENPAIDAPPLKENKDDPDRPKPRIGDFLGLHGTDSPSKAVQSERFYVKHIPARQFMCSADQSAIVDQNPWLGYWDIHYLEDIKSAAIYKNTDDLKATVLTREDRGSDRDSTDGAEKVKLYYIWATREKRKYVFAEGHSKPIYDRAYKRRTIFPLRYDVDPNMFWPIPPIYHEIHPQLEFNDSREWLRKNRKGTVPRYTYDRRAIDPKDMKKLESGEMGTYIPREKDTHGVIEPVPQPNYSPVAQTTLALSKEEFTELSMVAGERRGVAQSDTATQAKIIDTRSQVQESFDRTVVAKWLEAILEEMVYLAIDKMSVRHVILNNADPFAAGYQLEAQRIDQMWKEITYQDLREANEAINWEIRIESSSMSPVAEQQEDERWMQAMSLLANPIMTRLLSVSPALRKKTLDLKGIKSARDQELIGEALQIMVQMEREMAMMGGPGSPGMASQPGAPPGAGGPSPGPPPPELLAQASGSSGPVNGSGRPLAGIKT